MPRPFGDGRTIRNPKLGSSISIKIKKSRCSGIGSSAGGNGDGDLDMVEGKNGLGDILAGLLSYSLEP